MPAIACTPSAANTESQEFAGYRYVVTPPVIERLRRIGSRFIPFRIMFSASVFRLKVVVGNRLCCVFFTSPSWHQNTLLYVRAARALLQRRYCCEIVPTSLQSFAHIKIRSYSDRECRECRATSSSVRLHHRFQFPQISASCHA